MSPNGRTKLTGPSMRIATRADVPAMARCRLTDPAAGPADLRMASYLDGHHHPEQALAQRSGYLAAADQQVVGYIAGHLTTRHDCTGEIQYLFVDPAFRRRGLATELVCLMAVWFLEQGARRVCVCLDADSPSARPFYESTGADQLSASRRFWYVWEDIGMVLRPPSG